MSTYKQHKDLFGKFEAIKKYPGVNQPSKYLSDLGIVYTGSFFDTLELAKLPLETFFEASELALQEQHEALTASKDFTPDQKINLLENRKKHETYNYNCIRKQGYAKADSGFSGGTQADLYGMPSAERLEQLAKIDFSEKYKHMSFDLGEQVTRRKRVRSAHDGEWDMSRQWDTEPFMKRSVSPVLTKTVKINAHICFSGWTSATEIDKYGVFVAALTSYLESIGVGVDLNVKSYTVGMAEQPNCNAFVTLNVKKPDQYLPSSTLLQAFSANFFRRMIFTLDFLVGHAVGAKCNSGLGRPWAWGKAFHVDKDKGEINLYSTIDVDNAKTSTDIIKQSLDAFLKTSN